MGQFWKFCLRLVVSFTVVGMAIFLITVLFGGLKIVEPLIVVWGFWPLWFLGALVYSLAAFFPGKKDDGPAAQDDPVPPSVG